VVEFAVAKNLGVTPVFNFFYVLLTVLLSIILVINQINAQVFVL